MHTFMRCLVVVLALGGAFHYGLAVYHERTRPDRVALPDSDPVSHHGVYTATPKYDDQTGVRLLNNSSGWDK